VDSSGGNHPLSEQVLKEHRGVALRAQPAKTYGTSKQVAVVAAALAEEALTAPAALIDRVRNQRFATLERLAHTGQIERGVVLDRAWRNTLCRGGQRIIDFVLKRPQVFA